MSITDANYLFALGTLLLQLVTFALLSVYLMRDRSDAMRQIAASVSTRGLWLIFGVSLAASLMTLFYSDVLGVEPCPLCWWQRIFLYPQILLAGIAAWKKDASVTLYLIPLSIAGFLVALYHHALQMLPGSGLPCPAVGVSCAQRILFEFGYITFPLMAVTLFAFLILIALFVRSGRAQ